MSFQVNYSRYCFVFNDKFIVRLVYGRLIASISYSYKTIEYALCIKGCFSIKEDIRTKGC